MPEGSAWEIYIPQDKAYGSRDAGEMVKPFSALIFKLELVKVQK
jgi:FKBP-type peptidyl-prolyl cis-trans isomerase FklB